MSVFNKKYPWLLFIGDFVIFYVSLWLVLFIRYGQIPDEDLILNHILPFSILFIVWCLVFFITGLYEKQALILRQRLPSKILKAQIFNVVLAVLFFYFIPYFGITPKTTLFLYVIVSFVLIALWRIYGYLLFGIGKKQNAILIASGGEMKELEDEVNRHDRYSFRFNLTLDTRLTSKADFEKVVQNVLHEEASLIVADFKNESSDTLLPSLYNLIFSHVVFLDINQVYEDVFDRIPLSLITYSWVLENISQVPKVTYDVLKRVMDIIIAIPFGIISLILYPFIILAIKLDSSGPTFFVRERVGKNDTAINVIKFRTMTTVEAGHYDAEGKTRNVVTRVGGFLRKTRLDELPQLWNVIKGDLSLIGPRPELPSLVARYEQEIPYYRIRHLIKPGLSGWAQIYHDNHPHHAVAVEATKEKLSYDLYYIKNRSFMLDVTIALKTINKLISRSGA